jgi:hypothetical protein
MRSNVKGNTLDARPNNSFLTQKDNIVSWIPAQIAGRDPVRWNALRPLLVSEFECVLETATDESSLQRFFERSPEALLTGVVKPHTGWVIPRPSFPKPAGGSWVPDFMICEWTSTGSDWYVVELESPKVSPVTKKGDLRQACNHAVDQINSYRAYVEEHGHFLRGAGWPMLYGHCKGIVVIGRRNNPIRIEFSDRLRDLNRQQIEVISYDRLLENCRDFQDVLLGISKS